MTIAEMFGQSAQLALLGMGVVFGFLCILIICVTCMGKIVHALGLDKEGASKTAAAPAPQGQGDVVAVIGAAITQYQKENKV
jgi:sodium pump decarboxylase gamma subunit